MTISQRYGLFTVVPGIILLLIIGLLLTRSSSDSTESNSEPFDPHEAVELEDESVEQGVRSEQISGDKRTVMVADGTPAQAHKLPSNHVAQDSVDQLAQFAQQANHHARGTQQELDNKSKRPLNAFEPGSNPDKNHDHEDEPPPITQDVLFEALDSLNPAAQACYETLREDFPDASGKVHVTFIFETEDGESRVQMAEIDERTTLFDRGLHDCLSEAVSQLVLPKTRDDTRMVITNAFQFGPKKPR